MTSTPTPEPGERCAYIYSDGSTCDRFETAALDPNDSDDHPTIERLHLLLRAGHALLAAADRGDRA